VPFSAPSPKTSARASTPRVRLARARSAARQGGCAPQSFLLRNDPCHVRFFKNEIRGVRGEIARSDNLRLRFHARGLQGVITPTLRILKAREIHNTPVRFCPAAARLSECVRVLAPLSRNRHSPRPCRRNVTGCSFGKAFTL
jgi:hypothetical protein